MASGTLIISAFCVFLLCVSFQRLLLLPIAGALQKAFYLEDFSNIGLIGAVVYLFPHGVELTCQITLQNTDRPIDVPPLGETSKFDRII